MERIYACGLVRGGDPYFNRRDISIAGFFSNVDIFAVSVPVGWFLLVAKGLDFSSGGAIIKTNFNCEFKVWVTAILVVIFLIRKDDVTVAINLDIRTDNT